MRITIEITAGAEAGRKVWLNAGQSLTFGRTQLADFSIPGDSQISSVHFQVYWRDGGFHVRDLKSTNGLRVNGERIDDHALRTGDLVLAGRTKFAVWIEQESPETPPIPTSSVSSAPEAGIATEARLRDSLALGWHVPERSDGCGATEAKLRDSLVLPTANGPTATLVFQSPITVAETGAEQGGTDENEDGEADSFCVVDNHTRYAVAFLPWQNAEGEGRLTVVVKGTWKFGETGVEPAKRQLPISFADQHEEDDPLKPVRFEADTAPFKPQADIVLVGRAVAPGGRPRTSVDVRLRVGSLQRRLRVFGDRKWLFPTRLAVVPQMTDPVPFTEMPLTYRRAFGGIDEPAGRYCPENLSGVGYIGEPSPASVHNKPLPNVENPEQLITAWDVRPKPAGWGFYGRGWQPRLRAAGTYDDDHRRDRPTRFPADFSYAIHNGAHPDLQVSGYLDGDELVELENVTREGLVRFTLPGVRPKITLTRWSSESPRKKRVERPIKPFFDTLVFIPDERLFYAVFRAVFAVRDIESIDVAEIRVE